MAIAPPPSFCSGRPWTFDEDEYLLANPGAPAAEAAARLGRTRSAVHQRRARHRLEGRG